MVTENLENQRGSVTYVGKSPGGGRGQERRGEPGRGSAYTVQRSPQFWKVPGVLPAPCGVETVELAVPEKAAAEGHWAGV